MTRAACVMLSLLLWACEPASLPAPSILSVEPETLPAGGPAVISVRVNAVRPVSLDYQDRSADPSQLAVTLRIAGQVVDVAFVEDDGTLVAPVPQGLALGQYDIRVTLADGREAVRERAFSVVPPSTLIGDPGDGGEPNGPGTGGPGTGGPGTGTPGGGPKNGIWFFWVDPIPDQVRNVPFQVTLRAVGPGAKTFQSPVTLRASKGKVKTLTSGSFTQGVRTEKISLEHPSHDVYLLVEDANGNRGLSNSFRVRPH